jgi:hypothetical protein
LENWNPYRVPGAWPDADMLPLGMLNLGARHTRFTPDEQRTMMTLWSIARSPLMHGGDMTKTDDFTLSLLTNDEVLAVNQSSTNNRPLFNSGGLIAWTADVPDSRDKYLAVFNTRDRIPLTADKASYRSAVVTRSGLTEAPIDVSLEGATKLFLVIDPTEDGDGWDHALWIEPRLIFADGTEHRLTDLKWDHADADWDQVSIQKAPSGKLMSHKGRPIAYGLSTNGEALVEYTLPTGAVRFKATGALDDFAVHQSGGGTVRFLVFAAKPSDENPSPTTTVPVSLSEIGFTGSVHVRDLWTHQDLGQVKGEFSPQVPFHGAGLYRLTPE